MFRVALLDDYQGVALRLADWPRLHPAAQIEAFPQHIADEAALGRRLHSFEGVVLMRERTPFRRSLIERLPNLRLVVTAGMRNASLDVEAATERGIQVCGTEMLGYPTAELTWGLIIGAARKIPQEDAALRRGRWQTMLGEGLKGKTLGIVGLGRLGAQVAAYGKAFGMEVIAWSQNLAAAKAAEHGARLVTKEELFAGADFITIHLVLSPRSRGIVGAQEIGRMKATAYLVNTSRGPIVDEAALVAALKERRIAGAAIDVYDREPIAADHPLLALDNAVVTPHLGYATAEGLRLAYAHALEDIEAFLAGKLVRPINQLR